MEQRQSKEDAKKHDKVMEKLYSNASEEIEKEYEIQRKKYRSSRKKLCEIDDGEELWHFMEYSNDADVLFEVSEMKSICKIQIKKLALNQ